jgi:hypothetical protein
MNVILNSTSAAIPAKPGFSTNFTQDSHARVNGPVYAGSNAGRYTTEMSTMINRKAGSRVPYASALYAAAVAALLSACSQSGVEPAPKPAAIHLSETMPSDMPEVVVTASRDRPKADG